MVIYEKVIIIISSIVGVLLVIGIAGFFILRNLISHSTPTLSITYPNKTLYYVGEAANFNDLKVQIFDEEYIEINDYQITGFDSSKAVESQKINITVLYEGNYYYGYFYVTIKEVPKPNPTLVEIVLSKMPNKIEYKIGESFNPDGGILNLVYSDGSLKKVNLLRSYVLGFDSTVPNDNLVLTITYEELGILYSTTFSVRVVK